jgi:hypothetical protein
MPLHLGTSTRFASESGPAMLCEVFLAEDADPRLEGNGQPGRRRAGFTIGDQGGAPTRDGPQRSAPASRDHGRGGARRPGVGLGRARRRVAE